MSRPHARLRLACAVTLAAFGALLGAAPALATPTPGPTPTPPPPAPAAPAAPAAPDALSPLVDCVQDAPLGSVTSRTVVLGYRSSAPAALTIAPGSAANAVTSGAAVRGQPASFDPGEHHGVWLLTVDAVAEPDLAWRLGTAEARFDTAPACTAATAVTVSAPTQVDAGGTADVTAAVTRPLLGAPSSGTVSFALDGGPSVTAPVSPAGVARTGITVPSAGAHTVTATFTPDTATGLLASTGSAAFTATAAGAPLAVAADSVVAGSTSVLVTISRPAAQGGATVDVMTADGTAQSGVDYAPVATTVSLADGQLSATVRIALPARAPGSPAASFFVLLQRASTAVTTASAIIRLPDVPAATMTPASANASGGSTGAAALSSALPPDDPTAPTATATANGAQDLAMLVGGILITAGGIGGVLGLVRAAAIRTPRVG
ncbi:Calx-beta domain-containing protein [Leifsonia sp. NPDC077715]|uniref:Calx-beta domain-containing protein n=1 Tax=Leifsonia sp. NPDC077715 TaxID=3155539 RepID=UPI003440BCC6